MQSPLKVLERQGQYICFCYTLRKDLRSKDEYETTDQNFIFNFLTYIHI